MLGNGEQYSSLFPLLCSLLSISSLRFNQWDDYATVGGTPLKGFTQEGTTRLSLNLARGKGERFCPQPLQC